MVTRATLSAVLTLALTFSAWAFAQNAQKSLLRGTERISNHLDGARLPNEPFQERYLESLNMTSLLDVLLSWNPSDPTDKSQSRREPLTVLDWGKEEDREEAARLRLLELPFKVEHMANHDEVVSKWADDSYLIKGFSSRSHYSVGVTPTVSQMYYNGNQLRKEISQGKRPSEPHETEAESRSAYKPKGYTFPFAPPIPISMTFEEFWKTSQELEDANSKKTPSEEASSKHIYLTTGDSWTGKGDSIIGNDLQMFTDPLSRPFLLRGNSDLGDVRGWHVRVGSRGLTAMAHVDGHANWIFMLRGKKRYILSPPRSCEGYQMMHTGPSRRHTSLDLADPDTISDPDTAALLHRARAVDTVLSEGQLLYVPSWWWHHIVSLGRSVQANARSGISPLFADDAKVYTACERGEEPQGPTPEEIQESKALLDEKLSAFRLA